MSRRPSFSNHPRRYKRLAFYAGGFVLFVLVALVPADKFICLFRNLTGLPCVGCGLTSGFRKIFQLDFPGAWRSNILSIPLFLTLAVGFFWTAADCIRKRDTFPSLSWKRWKGWQKALLILFLSLLFLGSWSVSLLRQFHLSPL